jgi:exopolyphosphatase / guanosine-5'-triphosphate,3'-diphosphate pyrophosphatase
MRKIAAIDLGTNTFLCLIAEVEGHSLKVIQDVARVVRLGEGVNKNKKFLPQALSRATTCLNEFADLIKKHKVDHVIATATSAARDVSNGTELLDIGRERNIPISIIGGEKEARLSFEGAISAIPDSAQHDILVIDVGGGSTELIFRKAGESKIKGKSFDVGCVRLTEMFLKSDPVAPAEYNSLLQYAAKTFANYGTVNPNLVVAVAGTPTTLAAISQKIDFDETKVEGFILTSHEIKRLTKELGDLPLAERKKVKGIEPLRADVIVAGGALLLSALDVAGGDTMRVSTRGLRYGVALNFGEFL